MWKPVIGIEPGFRDEVGNPVEIGSIISLDRGSAGQSVRPVMACIEPVPHVGDDLAFAITMRFNVLAGQIRCGDVVAMRLSIEDEQPPISLPCRPLDAKAKIGTQFQWHIEPGQFAGVIQFDAGNIMDRQSRFDNQAEYLVKAGFAGIAEIERATRDIAARYDREAHCPE